MTSWGFGPFLDGLTDAGRQLSDMVFLRTEAALRDGHGRNDLVTTAVELEQRQAEIRSAVAAGMGGVPEHDPDSPPTAEAVGEIQGDGFMLEKLLIHTASGVLVPAHLYLPADLESPTGGVLFSAGHSPAGKSEPTYQAGCARLARNGLVALIIDPHGQGERQAYVGEDGRPGGPDGDPTHSYAGVQSWWLGDSPARHFLHDALRALDYLASRDEVDGSRLGAAGNSGGGTLTTWLMALDERIAAAAPACFIADRGTIMRTGRPQDTEQHLLDVAAVGVDHEDFLVAMAPRPVLVASANYDIFPIEGTLRTVERARRMYGVLGASSLVEHVRDDDVHAYTSVLAAATTRFMVRHLGDQPDVELDESEPEVIEESSLQCTPTGRLLVDRPEAKHLFDLSHERHSQLVRGRPRSRDEQCSWLSGVVHANRSIPTEFHPRWLDATDEADEPVVVRRVLWDNEVALHGAGILIVPSERHFTTLVVAVFDNGTCDAESRRGWIIDRARRGQATFVVDLRGMGALSPTPINRDPVWARHGTGYTLLSQLVWLGDSITAGRVFDLLRTVEFVRASNQIRLGDRPLELHGEGTGALPVSLASHLLDGVDARVIDPQVNPCSIVTTRRYGDSRLWPATLPGLVVHAPDLVEPWGGTAAGVDTRVDRT